MPGSERLSGRTPPSALGVVRTPFEPWETVVQDSSHRMTSPFATFHGSAATVAPFPTTGAVLERPERRARGPRRRASEFPTARGITRGGKNRQAGVLDAHVAAEQPPAVGPPNTSSQVESF
jgi:hypothetical protein